MVSLSSGMNKTQLNTLQHSIEQITQKKIQSMHSLQGGCVAQVYQVQFENGHRLVAKYAHNTEQGLDIEGDMLRYLAQQGQPVPKVIYQDSHILLMAFIATSGTVDAGVDRHAVALLSSMHQIGSPQYGFDYDTVIGGLLQPNAWQDSWVQFYAQQRLMHMALYAYKQQMMPATLLQRIENLCANLSQKLHEPRKSSLIHGDIWGGNVLCHQGRVAAWIDPAIYYGDAEVELAFISMFSTFGTAFWKTYQEQRPIDPLFFEIRQDVYLLYPLLVHVALFSGHYVSSLSQTLKKIGF